VEAADRGDRAEEMISAALRRQRVAWLRAHATCKRVVVAAADSMSVMVRPETHMAHGRRHCLAGHVGLELANVILGKSLKYWANPPWITRTFWDLTSPNVWFVCTSWRNESQPKFRSTSSSSGLKMPERVARCGAFCGICRIRDYRYG
jgi:hypothetical protein